jgi:hypothetical protein
VRISPAVTKDRLSRPFREFTGSQVHRFILE